MELSLRDAAIGCSATMVQSFWKINSVQDGASDFQHGEHDDGMSHRAGGSITRRLSGQNAICGGRQPAHTSSPTDAVAIVIALSEGKAVRKTGRNAILVVPLLLCRAAIALGQLYHVLGLATCCW